MADISAQIRAIQQASRGEEVRDSIVQALIAINGSIIDEQAITNAINELDVASKGGSGKYIKSIEETNGKISAVEDAFDTQATQNSAKPITSGAVYALKSTLEQNFQAGVDDIYDAVVAKGSTPASHSLSDVIQGIEDIPTGGGGGEASASLKIGTTNPMLNVSGIVGLMSNYGTDYIVPTSESGNIKLDLSQPFEIGCKFRISSAPGTGGRNIWGSSNSYYHCPTIAVFSNKIGVYITSNGSSWDILSGDAITPDGYSCPLNTWITAIMSWDGTDFSVSVNDRSNTYTLTKSGVTPYYNPNYEFEFGGQNKSSYSIAAVGAEISMDETYLKQGETVIWGVEKSSGNSIDEWDFTSSYIGTIRNLEATHSTNTTRTDEGVIFNDASDYVKLPLMYDGLTIEIDIGEMTLPSLSSHQRFIMSTAEKGFIYRSTGYWAFYNGSWVDSSESDRSFFNNSTLKIKIDSDGIWSIYKNDALWWTPSLPLKIDTSSIMIGSSGGQSITSAKISGARIY